MSESDEREGAEVLKSLPARRPQRRSTRRGGAKAPGGKPAAPRKTAASARKPAGAARKPAAAARKPAAGRKPAGVTPSAATRAASSTPGRRPAQAPEGIELVGTAVQAAGELAQLGLTLGTKALRGAVARIPRP
jgi:hypothetical protein